MNYKIKNILFIEAWKLKFLMKTFLLEDNQKCYKFYFILLLKNFHLNEQKDVNLNLIKVSNSRICH